jgi:hypothetical protein
MAEPSCRTWRRAALSAALITAVGLFISSDYVVDVDVLFLASALCSSGGMICGMALVRSGRARNNREGVTSCGPGRPSTECFDQPVR